MKAIRESDSKSVIVTHGTDTIIETAKYLTKNLVDQKLRIRVILTGSFLPEKFKDSDADFNLGLALGALQCICEKSALKCFIINLICQICLFVYFCNLNFVKSLICTIFDCRMNNKKV